MKLNLADRDKKLKCLLNEIKKNKKEVRTQYDELNELENNNIFLENVKDDYKKYYNHIVDEKTRQKEFMSILQCDHLNISFGINQATSRFFNISLKSLASNGLLK